MSRYSIQEIAIRFDFEIKNLLKKIEFVVPDSQKPILQEIRRTIGFLNDPIVLLRFSQPYLEEYTYHLIPQPGQPIDYSAIEKFLVEFDVESNSDFQKFAKEHNYNKTKILNLVEALRDSLQHISEAQKHVFIDHFLAIIQQSLMFKIADLDECR